MNEDLRVVKTKNAINSAFLKLLGEKDLKEITVKQISEAAQCNRNTFYLHYTDKYDLMEKLCVFYLDKMEKTLCEAFEQAALFYGEWYFDVAKRILEVIESDITFYEIVLGKNRYPDFADMYQALMVRFIQTGLAKTKTTKALNFVVEFSASGMVGFLRYWLLNQETYSKNEVAQEMYHLVLKVGSVIFE